MFIPRGKTVHENLATSYVLVEALVADLCESDFSGVVEIVLRQATGFILLDGGKVAAVAVKRGDEAHAATTVANLAAQSRTERGRLSVYGYAEPVAKALSGLLYAEPLYRRLSSEFADLQKMVDKFRRESDRHWFIEIESEAGTSLIFIRDGDYVVVTPKADVGDERAEESADAYSSALQELIDRSHRSGAIFNVYFRHPGDHPGEPVDSGRAPETTAEPDHTTAAVEAERGATEPPAEEFEQAAVAPEVEDPEENLSVPVMSEAEGGFVETAAAEVRNEPRPADWGLPTRELMALAGTDDKALEDYQLSEVKRLLSDVARGIEEITRVVEQRDDFSMHLRAGQLKVADAYPFLDPFGSDFEYIEGEIVFVGQASLREFIGGVSDALRLAVTNAAQVSSNPPRLRSEVVRKLKSLYERDREEYDRYGLNLSLEQIAGAQMAG